MDKRQKRSLDLMEPSPTHVYVFSANDHHNLKIMAAKRRRFIDKTGNDNLDINTKIAAMKASPFVVSLIFFSVVGEAVLSQGSGTIIEAEENINIVMTSLNLIRRPTETNFVENNLADNLKIVVHSSDENSYIGEVYTYDFHYNLLIIKFRSNASLQSAYLRMIDDDLGLDRSFKLRPHSLKVKPGDPVVVVGRYFYERFYFMAASGHFRIYLRNRELCHSSYGFEASNLYGAAIRHTLEKVIKRFPSISSGVLVKKVLPGSYAECGGLREDDIIKCDGKSVEEFPGVVGSYVG